jgi:sugar lactone lactonase YvrE
MNLTLKDITQDLDPLRFTEVSSSRMQCEEARGGIAWDPETGWLSWYDTPSGRRIHLCWLPVDQRSYASSDYNNMIAIGNRNGAVTIIDFAGTLGNLRKLGLMT